MTDWSELKRLAEVLIEYDSKPNDGHTGYDEIYAPAEWHALHDALDAEVVVALVNENISLKGSCKALGGRNLRKLERANRVLERKNAKHVANRNEFVSCMERKCEEIDNIKAANKTLLDALEALLPALMSKSAMMDKTDWLAVETANSAIAKARKTAAK